MAGIENKALRLVSESDRPSSSLPMIEDSPGDRPATVAACHRVMRESSDCPYYLHGGVLSRVASTDEVRFSRSGIDIRKGAPVVLPVSKAHLQVTLAGLASFTRYDARSRGYKPADVTAELAQQVIETADGAGLRTLAGVIECPTIRPDGSIIDQHGYDERTGLLYLKPAGVDFPKIPESPTRDDAALALERIARPFRGFPFCDASGNEGASRSVVVASMLTILVRRMLSAAPAFCFDATAPGSGKSLLQDAPALLATGRGTNYLNHTDDASEFRKRMTSLLGAGASSMAIDNVTHPLGDDALCTLLTAPTLTDRLLGSNTIANYSTALLVTVSGNNLVFQGDMFRRVLLCRLDAKTDRPEDRRFDFDPREEILASRADLVAACLTLLRAYIVAGRPAIPSVKPFGSFEDWSDLVRLPIVWAGGADPCGNRGMVDRADPAKSVVVAVLAAWRAAFGQTPATTGAALKTEDIELKAALDLIPSKSGRATAHAVGVWLRRNKDRYFALPGDPPSVARFVEGGLDARSRTALWLVETRERQGMGNGTASADDFCEGSRDGEDCSISPMGTVSLTITNSDSEHPTPSLDPSQPTCGLPIRYRLKGDPPGLWHTALNATLDDLRFQFDESLIDWQQ